MKTYLTKGHEVKRRWWVLNAKDQVLGRLAERVASRLRGKDSPYFAPDVDAGDYVVIINAEQIRVTGRKKTDKLYHHHTGYPGGIKTTTFEKMVQEKPTRIIEKAIKGMLPRGPLGRQMLGKLKVYAGGVHPHAGQEPEVWEI